MIVGPNADNNNLSFKSLHMKVVLVAFITNNASEHICQTRSIQSDEKERLTPSSDFITVTHTITSLWLIPQSLWLAVWNWLLERLCHICVMGVAYKNLAVSVSCHEVRFFSDASKQIWIWFWTNLSRLDWSDFWLRTQPI